MKNQLIIPIFKIKKLLLKNYTTFKRISKSSIILFSMVLQFLIQEIIELSIHSSRLDKRCRILPKDINWGLNSDEELSKLFKNIVIPSGGVISKRKIFKNQNHHKSLINRRKKSKQLSQYQDKNKNLNLNGDDYYDDSEDDTKSNYSSKSY